MNIFGFKLFRNIRERVSPKKKWCVTCAIFDEYHQRYFAQVNITTDARSRKDAENNIKDNVRLHITDAYVVKEKVNGVKQ